MCASCIMHGRDYPRVVLARVEYTEPTPFLLLKCYAATDLPEAGICLSINAFIHLDRAAGVPFRKAPPHPPGHPPRVPLQGPST